MARVRITFIAYDQRTKNYKIRLVRAGLASLICGEGKGYIQHLAPAADGSAPIIDGRQITCGTILTGKSNWDYSGSEAFLGHLTVGPLRRARFFQPRPR